MLQKLAWAVKTKTIEFFAEEEEEEPDLNLLDSAEEVITGQRVVVLKPDFLVKKASQPDPIERIQFLQTIISSLFATISSFKTSYLHLQTSHSPFDAVGIENADRSVVSHLQRLSEIKRYYYHYGNNPDSNVTPNFPLASQLEARVQENKSLLRTFELVVSRLQSDIERKNAEASALRQKLDQIDELNLKMTKRLYHFDSSSEVLLSVGLFDSVFRDTCRAAQSFTKMLIGQVKNAGLDLDRVANSVHPRMEYEKKGHTRYTFLSYICLVMFDGFNLENFGIDGDEFTDLKSQRKRSLMEFIEHGSSDPLEPLRNNPNCIFARYCETKYYQLIQRKGEYSLFGDFDSNAYGMGPWQATNPLYEPFVDMASSIWMLHKLGFSFEPTVSIFQVEGGVDFSIVYMESVVKRVSVRDNLSVKKTRPKVAFTVIPGFRVGGTIIQCQVYLSSMNPF